MAKKEQSRAFHMYVDDWLSSTKIDMMDAYEERGYLRLLLNAWKSVDCGLPDTEVELARLSKLGSQWSKPTKEKELRIPGLTSGEKLRRCFDVSGGRLYNARLLREWEYQKAVNAKRSEVGKNGAARKRQMAESRKQLLPNLQANGLPEVKQTGKQNASNYVSVSVSPEDLKKVNDAPLRFDLHDGFREIWDAYPKKGRTMQVDSEREYMELMFPLPLEQQIALHCEMLEAINGKFSLSEKWRKGFVLKLSEWIRNKCWGEDPEPAENSETQKLIDEMFEANNVH